MPNKPDQPATHGPVQGATHQDASLILRLYEIRREERMREARAFMLHTYGVETLEEHRSLCPPASKNDASFRMVVSYWDMASSFVTSGILNEELLLKNNGELLLVWARIHKIVPAIRQVLNDLTMWSSLEQVATSGIAMINRTSPGAWEARLKTVWRPNRESLTQTAAN